MRFADFTEPETRVIILTLGKFIRTSDNQKCIDIAKTLLAEANELEDYIIAYEKNWSGK